MSKDSLLDSTPENVDCLLKNLDEQYIKVERAIPLRSANVETVIEMRNCVNQTFLDLLKLMQSANVDISQIESATKNKQEFDTHVNNWIKSVTATPSFTNVPQASRAPSEKSIKSCSTSSSKSSSSSSKRREALVNYKLAVLKQKQAQERTLEVAEQARQEAERKLAEQQRETERKLAEQQRETERKLAEQNRIQREAARELELAITEMEVWETSSDILEKRYDKLKCDVPETVPGDTAGPSYTSQNDNQANISDATAPVVQALSQTSVVGPAIATTIKSTNLVNATFFIFFYFFLFYYRSICIIDNGASRRRTRNARFRAGRADHSPTSMC